VLLLGALSFGQVLAQGTATYELTFTATWSAATHPQDFPPNPHFSGLIGATHNSNVYFWATGEPASQGIRFMAELGTKGALTAEVNEALDQGTAFALLDGGSIPVSPGVRKMTFEIIPHYPLVTVTAMLAPSPDWFVGTRGLALLDNDRWVDSLIVDLFVYDAGTDSGPRYTSANQATNPPENIERIQTDPFLVDGSVRPVGTFRFDLKSIDLSREGYHTTNELEILDGGVQYEDLAIPLLSVWRDRASARGVSRLTGELHPASELFDLLRKRANGSLQPASHYMVRLNSLRGALQSVIPELIRRRRRAAPLPGPTFVLSVDGETARIETPMANVIIGEPVGNEPVVELTSGQFLDLFLGAPGGHEALDAADVAPHIDVYLRRLFPNSPFMYWSADRF